MQVADTVQRRREAGKNYGVALLPEGFFASLSDIRLLINDVKSTLDQCHSDGEEFCADKLSPWSRQRYTTLPGWLQKQMLQFDESSGELNHSQIQGERLMSELVAAELAKRKAAGEYAGGFNPCMPLVRIPGTLGYAIAL
jgi:pyrophosphate--fructose-6-phosphate 1-phosphotransferase